MQRECAVRDFIGYGRGYAISQRLELLVRALSDIYMGDMGVISHSCGPNGGGGVANTAGPVHGSNSMHLHAARLRVWRLTGVEVVMTERGGVGWAMPLVAASHPTSIPSWHRT